MISNERMVNKSTSISIWYFPSYQNSVLMIIKKICLWNNILMKFCTSIFCISFTSSFEIDYFDELNEDEFTYVEAIIG